MTPWEVAKWDYYTHHAGCTLCKAAGQKPGVLARCTEGAQLWANYETQPLPDVLLGPVGRGGVQLWAKKWAKTDEPCPSIGRV